jgi:hypothetical protein
VSSWRAAPIKRGASRANTAASIANNAAGRIKANPLDN